MFILFYSGPATIFSLAFFHLFVHFNSGPCQCISYWAEHTWSPLIPKSLLCASSSHHSVLERGSSVRLRHLPPGHWRCGGAVRKPQSGCHEKASSHPSTHTLQNAPLSVEFLPQGFSLVPLCSNTLGIFCPSVSSFLQISVAISALQDKALRVSPPHSKLPRNNPIHNSLPRKNTSARRMFPTCCV